MDKRDDDRTYFRLESLLMSIIESDVNNSHIGRENSKMEYTYMKDIGFKSQQRSLKRWSKLIK